MYNKENRSDIGQFQISQNLLSVYGQSFKKCSIYFGQDSYFEYGISS